jgi:hypothetical protein
VLSCIRLLIRSQRIFGADNAILREQIPLSLVSYCQLVLYLQLQKSFGDPKSLEPVCIYMNHLSHIEKMLVKVNDQITCSMCLISSLTWTLKCIWKCLLVLCRAYPVNDSPIRGCNISQICRSTICEIFASLVLSRYKLSTL